MERINVQKARIGFAGMYSIDQTNVWINERALKHESWILIFPRKPNCRSVITHLNHTIWGTFWWQTPTARKETESIDCRTKRSNKCFAGIFTARSIGQIQHTITQINYRSVNLPWSVHLFCWGPLTKSQSFTARKETESNGCTNRHSKARFKSTTKAIKFSRECVRSSKFNSNNYRSVTSPWSLNLLADELDKLSSLSSARN